MAEAMIFGQFSHRHLKQIAKTSRTAPFYSVIKSSKKTSNEQEEADNFRPVIDCFIDKRTVALALVTTHPFLFKPYQEPYRHIEQNLTIISASHDTHFSLSKFIKQ